MVSGRMLLLLVVLTAFGPVALHAQPCASLSKLASPTVSIVLAETVGPGTFVPAGGTAAFADLPAFCRVAAKLKPSSDSDIGTEIWLPISHWNGKLLAVGSGGWGGALAYDADQQVAPGSTIDFYTSVRRLSPNPAEASTRVRLFMAPGIGHCGGGEGPDTFDTISLIEEWVEQGRAPERIIAAHRTAGKVDRTRPLCPYPQVARYRGSGSIDESSNFVCGSPH